jgi:hypothetical protein
MRRPAGSGVQAKTLSRAPIIWFDVLTTSAPASVSRRDWLELSNGLVRFSVAGLAICCASWLNCWLLVVSAASPLYCVLGKLTVVKALLRGLIGGVSAACGQALGFLLFDRFRAGRTANADSCGTKRKATMCLELT